jgi:hypothetical protein
MTEETSTEPAHVATGMLSKLKLSGYGINVTIWLGASLLAMAFALLQIDSVFVDGQFIPFGNDGFYHATRILDAAFGERGFYQFDPLMHVPEGSWVVWPWGYDYLLAKFLQLVVWLRPATDPMSVLVYVPVAWIFVNMAMLVAITERIGLRREFRALTALGFALLPLTQSLHGIGQIDHHYIELFFIMLVTWTSLRCIGKPGTARAAILCGVSLGAAHAFHHGLFILQIPLLITAFILWLRNSLPPVEIVRWLALALFTTTLLAAIPSGPLWDMQFNVATLSWFHVYVAFCSAALLMFMSWQRYSMKSLAAIVLLALALAVPVTAQIALGTEYLAGRLLLLDRILEMQSPLTMIRHGWGLSGTVSVYSLLILLVPVYLLASIWIAVRDRRSLHISYAVFSVFGLSLMLLQYRLNYYGLVFMLCGGFYLLQRVPKIRNAGRVAVAAVALIVFAVSFQPPLRGALFNKYPLAGDHLYETTRPLLLRLEEQCASEPGIVLAASQFGHYIRYHTDCSVVANNFLLTELQSRKVQEVNFLFSVPPDVLATDGGGIAYVLAMVADTHEIRDGAVVLKDLSNIRERNPALITGLLFSQTKPEHAELIQTLMLDAGGGRQVPMAGLFKLLP